MTVESATYISDLNTSYPASGDPRSEGDDHLRLIKSTIKATFPSVTAAVTATHTELNVVDGLTATTAELNYVAGVTSSIQTQLNAKANGMVARASASLSGSDVDLTTGISSTTTQIEVFLSAASLSGTDNLLIQLGDAGGVETSAYASFYGYTTQDTNANITSVSDLSDSGFEVRNAGNGDSIYGMFRLTRMDPTSNVWAIDGHIFGGNPTDKTHCWFTGIKTLSDTITTVRLTSTGSNTFDAGTVYYRCN